MTNVSKKLLTKGQLNKLYTQLYKAFAQTTTKTAPGFLEELLGEEERVMLAKRLGAIYLCIIGASAYTIWMTLNMSPTTAQRIYDNYNAGLYETIERTITKNQINFKKACHILETILNAGFSPRGKGRWDRTIRLMNQK